ncbi:E3 ubiquitin-protein ligase COP1 [Hordeum vulgare]|nr:E3 ubiquitin-protein ligase COP1 [Hordeum vulgare]
MATGSKLSCLSWNKYSKNVIASSDYEGIVAVWDVQTRQSVMEYEEHEKRAWSVDFSRTEPKMLVSGSDDCKVETSDCIPAQQFCSDSVITDLNLLLCMPGQSVVHKSGSECH